MAFYYFNVVFCNVIGYKFLLVMGTTFIGLIATTHYSFNVAHNILKNIRKGIDHSFRQKNSYLFDAINRL